MAVAGIRLASAKVGGGGFRVGLGDVQRLQVERGGAASERAFRWREIVGRDCGLRLPGLASIVGEFPGWAKRFGFQVRLANVGRFPG